MTDTLSEKNISILHPQIKVVGWAMKQMMHLAEYFSKDNKVSFYSFLWNPDFKSQNDSFSISSSFSSYPLKFLSFFIIAWQIRKSDYIICGNSPMHFVAGISRIFFWSSAKIIWWHHHYPWYFQDNTGIKTYFKKIIERYFVWKVDTIVWNSRFLQKELIQIYEREVKLLYPYIDDLYFENNITIQRDWKTKTIFTAWRWEDWKWLSDIFKTYEVLKNKFDIALYIWWVWTHTDIYENKYSQNKNIKFLWELSQIEMKRQFEKSDIFLFPSRIDSFGMVIIESLLSWTPVISYDLWEAQYIIEDWINWFKVKTLDDFAKTIQNILNDEDVLNNISKNSKKSVVSNYSMKHFEKQLVKIIFEK